MPIYEYACEKCQSEFEVEQRISDDPIKTCPKCRSRRVKKLISKTSFVLKGSGWYSDLYSSAKKDGDKGESKTESGSDAGSDGGSEKSTEKKDAGGAKDAKKSDAKAKKGKSKAA